MNTYSQVPTADVTEPDLSDAEATLELTSVTASDILEVRNAVEAFESAAKAEAAPDRTLEVDAADILTVDLIDAPATPLPKATSRRAESRLAKRARGAFVLAAAITTWGFFASFAIFRVHATWKLASSSSGAASVALASPPSSEQSAASSHEETSLEGAPAPLTDPTSNMDQEKGEPASKGAAVHVSTTAARSEHAGSARLGILRVPQAVTGVLVDGSPQRVTGGALFLACGVHRIRAPRESSRMVRVPCGRTVTL